MYNKDFKILLFNTYMQKFHGPWFTENMPLCMESQGGSIWLKKM
jgi:hypothetical protein